MLTAADSLMDTDPDAALYSIMSIDSSMIHSMRKKDRALYLLLLTEAKYKCYMPISQDTIINEAVRFFARRGPESRYASALTIRGAAEFERGDFVSALEDYKNAESIISRGGNMNMTERGLLHTRIAELYQFTFVNDSLAADRYRRALECFQQSGRHDLVMRGRLSLARALLPVSPDDALANMLAGMGLARQLADSSMMLVARELHASYLLIKERYGDVIGENRNACREFQFQGTFYDSPMANIMLATATAYAKTGHPDSAHAVASCIPTDILSRPAYHTLLQNIAMSEGKWESALEHFTEADRIIDSTLSAGYQMHLLGVEKRYAISRINEQYSSKLNRYFISFIILLGIMCATAVSGAFVYSRNLRLKRKIENCTDIIRNLNEEKSVISSNGITIPNRDSQYITEEMLKVTDELMEAYYKYGNTKAISTHVKAILEQHFPNEGTMARVLRIVDSTYPGYLSGLRSDYPALSEKDIYLIALMACGFSTGTICALRRISENSLYVEKTRVAKKIGGNIRLSDFIARSLQANRKS